MNVALSVESRRRVSLSDAVVEIARNRWQLVAQMATFVACGAYGVVLFVATSRTGTAVQWQTGLRYAAMVLPVVPILIRARRYRDLRRAWLTMGVGVILLNVAGLVHYAHVSYLVRVATPTVRDAIYACSYLAIAVAVALVMQHSFGPRANSVRLDGIIAGLALAAVVELYGVKQYFEVTGRSLIAEFNIFNPILVLVLLVLLAAGLVPRHFHTDMSTTLLFVGLASLIAGDIIALNRVGVSHGAALIGLSRALGLSMVAFAAWPWGLGRRATRDAQGVPRGLNLIPVIFGVLSTAVLAISVVRHTSESTRLMALASLSLVILRMVITQGEVRLLGRSNFVEARTDHVTGLSNRRAFLEDGEEKLASLRENEQLGIVLVDLNGFKEVNDTIGHAYGDELLKVIGQRFAERVGDRGTVARLGGDEFAYTFVVQDGVDPVASANELAQTLGRPVSLDGTKVRVSASVGVAIWPQHGATHAELLRSADVAMYEAKRLHGGVCAYREEIDVNSRERLALINELRTAIDRRRLTLHFQPTLDLRSGAVHGVEALVRWEHPTLGMLLPDYFVPLAERVGLINPLTRTVLDLAITELARLDRCGHSLQMSVNISQWDLMDEYLPESIGRTLKWFDIAPERITLEVTESSLSQHPEQNKRSLALLRAARVKISIDDFGVGYSSMSQLLELAVDELKIDKSFVLALETDTRAIALIRSIIEMARALDLEVVAEGVENPGTLEALRRVGTDIIQGDYIGRPLTGAELDGFLELHEAARPPQRNVPEAVEQIGRRQPHLHVV